MKRFIKIIIPILLIASLFLYIYDHKKNNKAFNIFGNYISVVVSESMEPTIMTNDFVVYKKANEYKVDDIIVFSFNGELIIHRIISKSEDGYITQGDNNSEDDYYRYGFIKDEQILGKLVNNFHLLGLGKLLIN